MVAHFSKISDYSGSPIVILPLKHLEMGIYDENSCWVKYFMIQRLKEDDLKMFIPPPPNGWIFPATRGNFEFFNCYSYFLLLIRKEHQNHCSTSGALITKMWLYYARTKISSRWQFLIKKIIINSEWGIILCEWTGNSVCYSCYGSANVHWMVLMEGGWSISWLTKIFFCWG